VIVEGDVAAWQPQFEETHRCLADAGAAQPEGRLHHSCIGDEGNLMVYDIWESPDAFQAFGATLMPILAEIGVDPGDPAIMPMRRIQQQSHAAPIAGGVVAFLLPIAIDCGPETPGQTRIAWLPLPVRPA
jgi:hypothetical protein